MKKLKSFFAVAGKKENFIVAIPFPARTFCKSFSVRLEMIIILSIEQAYRTHGNSSEETLNLNFSETRPVISHIDLLKKTSWSL